MHVRLLEETPLMYLEKQKNEIASELSSQKWVKLSLIVMNVSPIVSAVFFSAFSSMVVYTGGISVVLCLVFPAFMALSMS